MLIAAVPSLVPRHRDAVTAPVVLATSDMSKTYTQRGWFGRRRGMPSPRRQT